MTSLSLNEQRTTVFRDRYSLKNDRNEPTETSPKQMWARVAKAIADNHDEEQLFENVLTDFKFVPGGRILAGAGAKTEQTFYNCYVIPVEPKESTRAANPNVGNDSREAIFDTIGTMVDIMSRGGGVGINWSTLRPSGAYLARVSGTSSGPVGWMDVASKAVGEVEQGGSRRGAAMFMLDDWHPDLLKFIEAKRDYTRITNANVSIAVSDRFMEAVKNDAGWSFEFPNTSEPRYNTEWDGDLAGWKAKGLGVSIYKSMPARDIWKLLVEAAHASGEPGVVFLDRYNRMSTGAHAERIICVNPCGEQGLGAYSVCNLGSMNLAAYVTADNLFDFASFRADVGTATRFLDNVIDKSFYWDDRSRQRQLDLRRIGLGVMGLADMLIRMGIRYGSADAVKVTEEVFLTMKDAAIEESMKLAQEKGPARAYEDSVWARPYLRAYSTRTGTKVGPLRNLFFLTQAPTGTTSILAGVNSGIEPFFALGYWRNDRTGRHYVVPEAIEAVYKTLPAGTYDEANWPEYIVTANDVTVEEHIAMQAAVQKYVDSSVSKTINGPNRHTVADVDKAYRLAYDSGLKGLAYFRDGSGRDQVLSTAETTEKVADSVADIHLARISELEDRNAQLEEAMLTGPMAGAYRRPAALVGTTSRLNTSMGTMYLTVNTDSKTGKPVEIFVNVGKAGSDVMSMGEAIGRLVSLGLQHGISMERISSQLVGVGGTSQFNPGLVHAIGRNLAEVVPATVDFDSDEDETGVSEDESTSETPQPVIRGQICPECGQFSLVREEGCEKCYSCGYTAC